MSPIFAGIAAFFSVAAFVFYVIAASGYSKNHKVLKGCNWIYFKQNDVTVTDDYYPYAATVSLDVQVYYGLKGFYLHAAPGGGQFHYYYNSGDNYSNECNRTGINAISLTIIACIFSFISIITNGVGFVNEETAIKAGGAVLSIIACLFGMIAVGVFMTTCYNKIYDFYDDSGLDNKDLHYGNGSILAVTALLCNFFAFILAIINIVAGGSTPLSNQK